MQECPLLPRDVQPPLILVTNDDGIESPGLRAAAEAAAALGQVLVAAPIVPQTAMGRSFPHGETQGTIEILHRPLGEASHLYYAVHGSPAQAVAHAILEIAPRRPALCISGINDGENLGGTNLVSGTVGAAAEAAGLGVRSIAVSIDSECAAQFARPYESRDWIVAGHVIRRYARYLLDEAPHLDICVLNINIPAGATLDTEIRITAQSRQYHYACAAPGPRDFAKPFRLPVRSCIDLDRLEPESDLYGFLVDRVISVTPMGCDLTIRDAAGRPRDLYVPRANGFAAEAPPAATKAPPEVGAADLRVSPAPPTPFDEPS